MPIKNRQLQVLLRQRGYHRCRDRGSHQIWTRPGQARPIVFVGSAGDDALAYQVTQVRKSIRRHRKKPR